MIFKSNAAMCLAYGNPEKVKLQRAYGGCLGARGRRRTQRAAISHGEPQAGFDPWVSEWGNPLRVMPQYPYLNKIGYEEPNPEN